MGMTSMTSARLAVAAAPTSANLTTYATEAGCRTLAGRASGISSRALSEKMDFASCTTSTKLRTLSTY